MGGYMVCVYTIGVGNSGLTMENPASWNPTQKKINRALRSDGYYSKEQATYTVNSILAALKANGLLKQSDPNLTNVLCQEIMDYQSHTDSRMCGASLSARLYNKLVSVGAL